MISTQKNNIILFLFHFKMSITSLFLAFSARQPAQGFAFWLAQAGHAYDDRDGPSDNLIVVFGQSNDLALAIKQKDRFLDLAFSKKSLATDNRFSGRLNNDEASQPEGF